MVSGLPLRFRPRKQVSVLARLRWVQILSTDVSWHLPTRRSQEGEGGRVKAGNLKSDPLFLKIIKEKSHVPKKEKKE